MFDTTTTPDSFARVFTKGRLSIGLITPLEAYPDSPFPTLKDHQQAAKQAEDAGFSSLWIRDVPFYDPKFGDAAQVLDPFVYAGYLAAVTERITLGTTGIVLPLREPVAVAKQALSIDQLTDGRFVLGLSTGDRPVEYPAFNIDFEDRAARYREAIEVIRTLSENHFPKAETIRFGTFSGTLDMLPKPIHGRLPIMAVGRSGQPIEWLAQNVDAWIWAVDESAAIREIISALKTSALDGRPPAYGYSTFFDLDPNPDAPYQRCYNVVRIGRKALTERLLHHRDLGVQHVALNLKPSRRSTQSVIGEMGTHVLPELAAA
ncbi:TIGR03571 family LLM class oxidoreductase [Donghicola sp.]|jgi:luciferase-type oxidoreductase|uniref:TIGR03571 family LLM class oxidoreductase n=1 Tax=Donghicola sp. TaxID=1929294 RepID=UPI0025FCEA6B|nr:TIGR03571 family LLM class oxidoreductase [Donghicola sp.]MCT4577398.1 TIGR03571 family LLM class oxidoreductase [Donghicola sp.]